MKVINKDGLIHNCHTEERYKSFIASGWKPYKEKPNKTNPEKDEKPDNK